MGLGRTGAIEDAADAAQIAAGRDPGAVRSAERARLGYDPALLGGRAATRELGSVHREAVATADELGFTLTPGQRQGNRELMGLEASARSTPWAASGMNRIQDANQFRFNQLFNEAISQGENKATEVTMQGINNAEKFVSDSFAKAFEAARKTHGGIPAPGINALVDDIVAEWKNFGIELPGNIIKQYELANKPGLYDPVGLLAARQRLNSLIRQAKSTGETTKIEPYSQMIEAIDSAVQASSKSMSTNLAKAREVHRLLIALEKPGVWKEEKNVAVGPLYRALKGTFRAEMRGGLNIPGAGATAAERAAATPREIANLVRAVRMREAVLKDVVSDSGTATRMTLQTMFSNPVRTLAEQVAGRAATAAYLQFGVRGKRLATAQGGEQLTGIWGSTW